MLTHFPQETLLYQFFRCFPCRCWLAGGLLANHALHRTASNWIPLHLEKSCQGTAHAAPAPPRAIDSDGAKIWRSLEPKNRRVDVATSDKFGPPIQKSWARDLEPWPWKPWKWRWTLPLNCLLGPSGSWAWDQSSLRDSIGTHCTAVSLMKISTPIGCLTHLQCLFLLLLLLLFFLLLLLSLLFLFFLFFWFFFLLLLFFCFFFVYSYCSSSSSSFSSSSSSSSFSSSSSYYYY